MNRAAAPTALGQRLTFQRVAPDTGEAILEGASVPVSGGPVVIGPPLRGEWVAINGPSNTSGHRRSAIPINGVVAIGQRFAIDYLQVDEKGNSFRNDRSVNENFLAEGQDILSVAAGTVVDTKDSIPENVPGGRAVPITLATVAGNYIVLDIGGDRFALYAHLKPGSLRVKVGDRVQRGQVIGLVGNSGNSTEPHLHFHLADARAAGSSTLGAEGIPYAHETLEIVGRCALVTAIGPCTRATVTVRNAMPLQNQMVRFPK
ncbi:MAG: M23 family metallopeptidase [Longimicrobiales bacterium]